MAQGITSMEPFQFLINALKIPFTDTRLVEKLFPR